MATVLFAGFGDVGGHAGELLAAGGLRVIALKRTPPAQPANGVEYHAVDLRAPFTLPPSLRAQPDAVVIAVSPSQRTPEDYAATYVGAVEHTLRAVQQAAGKPRLVLFVSSTAVWAESSDVWITEDTPARPDSWNGEILLRAENAMFASPYPATTLRLGGIYGPGRLMMVRKAEAVLAGREPLPAPAWTNRIHRDDASRLVAFLVNRALSGHPCERVINGVDNEPALNVDVLAYISQIALERQARDNNAQGPAVMPLDFNRPMPGANTAVGGKRVGNARVRALGFQLQFPDFRAGYATL